MPAEAAEPCEIFLFLGFGLGAIDEADLETGFNVRGQQIVDCDRARQLAVDTHAAEHADEDAWAERRRERRRPGWKVW